MIGRTFTQAVAVGAALCFGVIASAQELIVGANVGNVPYEFQDDTGEIVGFEVDLVKEIGERLGREVKLENVPFNGLFAAVQSGRIDMAISSITITQKRMEDVSFAQPYFDSDLVLAVLGTSGYKGLSDMASKAIAVETGATSDIWAVENQEKYNFGEIRRYEGLGPAVLDLGNGRIDGYISDVPALSFYIRDKPEFTIVERIPTGEQYSIMFDKDSPLAAQVNDILTDLKNDGFFTEIHKKWFGTEPDPNTTTAKVMDMPKLQ
ncbi:MAG: transporter substrate-binding domain-containing protein [Albidovulum sp.]